MSTRLRVAFHRARALAWLAVGAASFPLGWADSVPLVWAASLYANVVSDWGAGEAADDRAVTDRLDRIEQRLAPPRRRPARDATPAGARRRTLTRRTRR